MGEVREIELPEITVLFMEYSACIPSKTNTVTISTSDSHICVVDLVVDSGSFVSILPYSTYACHSSCFVLSQPTAKLVTYPKSQIPVVGCLLANGS